MIIDFVSNSGFDMLKSFENDTKIDTKSIYVK